MWQITYNQINSTIRMNKYWQVTNQRSILSYFSGAASEAEVEPEPAPPPSKPQQQIDIFCDGACANNGKKHAKAGFGVFIRVNGVDTHAISEALRPDEQQTNQRAELRALQYSIIYASKQTIPHINIYSDSEYAINCITKWAARWKRSNWVKPDKDPVQHRDIIEPTFDIWVMLSPHVRIQHVAAHTGRADALSRGNEIADNLATAALDKN